MWGFSLWHQFLCYQSSFRCFFFLFSRQSDVARQVDGRDGTVRAALWQTAGCHSTQVTSSVLDSHRQSEKWMEKRYVCWLFIVFGSFFTLQDGCVKHYSLLLCLFSCQASRNLFLFAPWTMYARLPEEGSTSLPNVIVTSAIYSIPAPKALLCNLFRRSMQTEVIILTFPAHSLHVSHPFNLIFTILKRKLFRLKHSLPYTLWFMKDTQYNLQQTSVTYTCLSRFSSFPFFLSVSLSLSAL